MKKWFYTLVALLLAAPALQAQNSFNIWTADRAAPIDHRHRKTRAVKPKPEPPVVEAAPVKPAEEPLVKQSKLIKRGLTQRMHEHKPLAEDSVSMVFFRENSRYPVEAQKAGAQGSVVIKLEIKPDGEVSKTSIVSMQPRVVAGRTATVPVAAMQSLADEAQRIFRMLRFEPAQRTSVEELTASFSLN